MATTAWVVVQTKHANRSGEFSSHYLRAYKWSQKETMNFRFKPEATSTIVKSFNEVRHTNTASNMDCVKTAGRSISESRSKSATFVARIWSAFCSPLSASLNRARWWYTFHAWGVLQVYSFYMRRWCLLGNILVIVFSPQLLKVSTGFQAMNHTPQTNTTEKSWRRETNTSFPGRTSDSHFSSSRKTPPSILYKKNISTTPTNHSILIQPRPPKLPSIPRISLRRDEQCLPIVEKRVVAYVACSGHWRDVGYCERAVDDLAVGERRWDSGADLKGSCVSDAVSAHKCPLYHN